MTRISNAERSACRGDTIEVHPTYENIGFRIELWGDEVALGSFDPLTGDMLEESLINSRYFRKATSSCHARGSNKPLSL